MKNILKKLLIFALCISFVLPICSYGEPEDSEFVSNEIKTSQGVYIIGIALYTNAFATVKPYKDAGERDWEVRKTAIEGYNNFGISQVETFINVRKSPSTDGDIIGKMTNNNACDILETSSDGEWYKISSGKVEGWVSSEYIMTGWQGKDEGRAQASLRIKINAETLNVRSEAKSDSEIWTQVNSGASYDVVKEEGDWVEIAIDDSVGYVEKEFVTSYYTLNTAVPYTPPKEVINQSKRDKIVNYAMKWLGGRYVWGGETLGKGVDCSGFTMCVLGNFGIGLSHHAATQAGEGRSIKRSQLKKGDLVFYSKNGSINHVAIYIGDGQVIHAGSVSTGIHISDLDYRSPVKFVTYLDD